MSSNSGKIGIGLAGAVACAGLLSAGVAGAATVVVSPANMEGWSFQSFDGNFAPVSSGNYLGTAQMVNGPGTPPFGTGSANLATNPGYGNGGEALSTQAYDGTALSAITSLSYYTYMTTNNGSQFPYIALAISTDGNPIASDGSNLAFIDFEPPYQTPTTGNPNLPNQGAASLKTWQFWNALEGGWDAPNAGTGVSSLSAFLTEYPKAAIANPSNVYPGFAGINLQVGFGNPTDNFNGNVDGFSIGISNSVTTFDFEPAPAPASFGLVGVGALALIGGLALRRRVANKL